MNVNLDSLVDLINILLRAGTCNSTGHMHGLLDQRSRIALETLLSKLEMEQSLEAMDND